jgi:hypothetical protein
MDKYSRHLQFLKDLQIASAEDCEAQFGAAKRDVRQALHLLLQGPSSLSSLLEAYRQASNGREQMLLLKPIFQHFCPNPAFNQVLDQVQKRKVAATLDTETFQKLQHYRIVPSPEQLKILFDRSQAHTPLLCGLFQALQPFGPQLGPWQLVLESYARETDLALSLAAIELLGHCGELIPLCLGLWGDLFQDPQRRFAVLRSLQRSKKLPVHWVYALFSPLLEEYQKQRRLEKTDQNSLWEEVNLMRSILRNNGGGDKILWLEIL